MNRIATYLFSQFALAVFFACLAVTVVVWFSQSVRMLALVINNGGSMWAFLKLMVLLLPTFMPLLLPISLVVGVLFVFHRLIMESELVVMRAAGLSPFDLAKPVLLLGFIVAGLGYLFTIVIAPVANHELVRLQYQIRNDHSVLLLRTGTFNDITDGLTFYARERGRNGDLHGILLHDTRKPERPTTIMAESGELVRTPEGPKILIHNGTRQEVERASGILSQLSFESYLVDLGVLGDNFATRWRDPRERNMIELLEGDPIDRRAIITNRFLAEFHSRLAMPFLAVTFSLVAALFMLTGVFDRRGITRKVILAGGTIVLMEALMLLFIQLISKDVWMVTLLYLLSFAPLPFLLHGLIHEPAPRRLIKGATA